MMALWFQISGSARDGVDDARRHGFAELPVAVARMVVVAALVRAMVARSRAGVSPAGLG